MLKLPHSTWLGYRGTVNKMTYRGNPERDFKEFLTQLRKSAVDHRPVQFVLLLVGLGVIFLLADLQTSLESEFLFVVLGLTMAAWMGYLWFVWWKSIREQWSEWFGEKSKK